MRAIHVQIEQVSLSDDCLGCGRCVAVCPTDALQLDGYAEVLPSTASAAVTEIECAKVPPVERAPGAVQVPCLGALSAGRLAALHEAAGAGGVALVDRGWCGACTAGCATGEHPAARAFEQLTVWLEAAGDTRAPPRWAIRPLPIDAMPVGLPAPMAAEDDGPPLSRRQFFRAVVEDPVGRRRKGVAMGTSGHAAFPPGRRREAPERRRMLDVLDKIAEREGAAVPAEFFPAVTASSACVDHRVCTAACPTGALKMVAIEGASSLTHSAAACIACGACISACPEGALSLDPHGGVREPTVLASHEQRLCTNCGDSYSPRADEAVCLACSKSQRFIGDAMSQLFAARN